MVGAHAEDAERYGISDVALAKTCKRLRIPKPNRGYWAIKEAGKRVTRPRLPSLPPGQAAQLGTVTLGRNPAARSEGSSSEESGPVAEQRRYEALDEHRIVVPDKLSRPHPLVKQTADAFRGSERGFGYSPKHLDINVERKSQGRAFRIMDAVIKALEERGFSVRLSAAERPHTLVSVLGEDVRIRLEERYKRVEQPPERASKRLFASLPWRSGPTYETVATGELRLKILNGPTETLRKTWADAKRRRVEDCLNEFVIGLVGVAEVKKAHHRRLEEERRRREEEQRQWRERQRREQEERLRAQRLEQLATKQAKAMQIRRFVAVARRVAERQLTAEQRSEFDRWLSWAAEYADRVDPLRGNLAALRSGVSDQEVNPSGTLL